MILKSGHRFSSHFASLHGGYRLSSRPGGLTTMPIDKRVSSGGAGGAAFYTPVGFGTALADGKETRRFGDRDYVLEQAIVGDLALVRADTADRYGNLTFRYAQANFGPVMATAARLAVAEVRAMEDEPIEHTRVQLPGIYVDRVLAVGDAR